MLFYLDQLPDAPPSADVCIIGAGPAGLTLATELAAQGITSLLCEGGDLEYTDESQACYEGDTVGDDYHYLDAARLRFLGGTSNHWTGVCADLEPEDLDPKPFAPQTGWPIDMATFRPYITRARAILGLPPTLTPRRIFGGDFARLDVKVTQRLRFRDIYLESLRSSAQITTLLHANLTGLERAGDRITGLQVQSYSGRRMTLRARHFVIACGGIENARLLMHLNEQHGAGFGSASDALGAYFTEHPHGKVGEYVFFDDDRLYFPRYGPRISRGWAHFAATEAFLNRTDSLNVRLKLVPYREDGARQVVDDLLCRAPRLAQRLRDDVVCAGEVGMVLEQVPLAENRVELGTERDRFGIRRPVLHWRVTAPDYQTIREVSTAFARHLADQDLGRMSISDWVLDPSLEVEHNEDLTAYHHIGTTRMAATEEQGVTDPDCRVFGSENLFLAGSSVFPSAGHANPTAPIIALSLRLADHLARQQG